MSWDETEYWFDLLGIISVPVLYRGPWNEELVKDYVSLIDTKTVEGIVVRKTNEFSYGQFQTSVAKWVRPGHVQTTKHWRAGQRLEKNELEIYDTN